MLRKKKWVILAGLILLAICMVVPGVMVLASSSAAIKVSGTIPLTIYDVVVSNITSHSAAISWKTNNPSGSQVNSVVSYGVTLAYGSSVSDTSSGLHSVNLSSLSSNATYYFQIQSTITGLPPAIYTGSFKTLNSAPALTKLVLVALPSPSDYGQTVYFGAAVILPNGNGIPTGTVTFKEGANILGTGQLYFGVTGFSTSSLSVGTHNIQAVYSGDSNYAGSSSNVVVQKVHYDSKITLTSTPNPSTLGQSVTFTAKVTGSSGTPTGNVDFRDGLTVLGSVPLSGGTATFSTSVLSAGSHPITAGYSGDSNYSVSLSNVVVQVVKDKNKATINLSSSLNPSDVGQLVKFTATMSPGNATGTVQFKIDGTNFGSPVTLSGGQAISGPTKTLTAGNHNITAVYSGDTTYAGSTDSLAQKVKGKTVCTWPTKPTTVSFGKPCTFSVQIGTQSGTGNPTGAVTFYDGGKTLGTGSLGVDGHATFIISSLSKGTHSITATYAGDDNFDGSNSNTFSQVIK